MTLALTPLLMLMTLSLTTGQVAGAFTATVANSANSLGSAKYFVTATATVGPTVQCTSVPPGSTIPATAAFPCTGSTATLPAQAPGAAVVTTTSSLSTAISVTGTTSPTTASLRALSCAPVSLVNPVNANDPLLARGGLGFGAVGPFSDTTGLAMNGSDTLGTEPLALLTPATMTFAIWFRAAPASAGGVLFALDTGPAQILATTTTRVIWLDSTGNVRAGNQMTTNVGGRRVISSTGTDYRDGAWHLAVARVTSSGGTAALQLLVDNVSKGTVTLTASPKTWTGYWHVGWGDVNGLTNWSGVALFQNNYFAGTLANAVVFNSSLSPAALTSLWSAATQATWLTAVNAIGGILGHWPLNDLGNSVYTGLVFGSVAVATLCTAIQVRVDETATPSCVYPTLPSAVCPAMSNSVNLNTFAGAAFLPLKPSTTAIPQTLTTTVARASTYTSATMVGLHLLVPLQVVESVSGFGYTLTWPGNRYVV